MPYLLCRNRVNDVATWRAVFASHQTAHQAAGLELMTVWPSQQDSKNLFFLFRVSSMSDASAFINDSEAGAVGQAAGVLDGEYHFLSETYGY